MRIFWSAEDDGYLARSFRKKPSEEIGADLCRTPKAVEARATKIGLRATPARQRKFRLNKTSRKKGRRWSAKDEAFLRRSYYEISSDDIAAVLGRTRVSVYARASVLELSTPRPKRPPSSKWTAYATDAAYKHAEDPVDVLAGDRSVGCARARWVAFRALRNEGYSLPGIASVSGFDHSTVFYGIKRLNEIEERESRISVGKPTSMPTRLIQAVGM